MRSFTAQLALLLTFGLPLAMKGQAPTNQPLSVPTTKVLAIGNLPTPLTAEQKRDIMPREVPATVRLYLAGKIDQWYVRKEGNGVVFILNVASTQEAHDLLEQLPLGQAKLMTFELMPLGPLSPLSILLKDTATDVQKK